MVNKGRIKAFLHLSLKIKILICATFSILGVFRFLLLVVPFQRLSSFMGVENKESPLHLTDDLNAKASTVAWAVEKTAKHTPWQSKCLVRALTAQFLLKLLHIPNTIYLGLSKDENHNLVAHAWLRAGGYYITGGIEKDKYHAVAYFSSP